MKSRRQNKIIELINSRSIETQEERLGMLFESGFNVTQATVSRDIKELRLIKSAGPNGKYRYVAPQPNTPDISVKFYSLFGDSVSAVDYGQNIVCVKCYSGMAQAVCSAMDSLQWESVVGTLAGDDTIFILCRNEETAVKLTAELGELINH